MNYACSRCANRQAEDAECSHCKNPVVQDLRDSRGRQVLAEAESRWQRRRQTRSISVAAVLGILFYIPVSMLTGGLVGMAGAVCGGFAAHAVLERVFPYRPRFPYLDEFEQSADRTSTKT